MHFIMVVQLLWFGATFLARIAKGFAIPAIELNIVALIFSTLPIDFLWRHKPADVRTAETLVTDASIDLVGRGDVARGPYSQTPLDFISRKEWAWSVYWSHMKHALQRLHMIPTPQSSCRPIF